MVNAQAAVAPKGKVAVVPPAVTFGRLIEKSVAVVQTQGNQRTQVVALFFGAMDLLAHALWVPNVVVVEGDVVVTHEHQLRVLLQLIFYPGAQAFEPLHLVLKFVTARSLAVGEIGAYDSDAGNRAGDDAGHVVGKTRNIFHKLGRRRATEQRHAVVGFLTKPLGLVARRQKRVCGKLVVCQFGFLQDQYVYWVGLQPIEHLGQAHGQGVHIPGGELHGAVRKSRFPPLSLVHCHNRPAACVAAYLRLARCAILERPQAHKSIRHESSL